MHARVVLSVSPLVYTFSFSKSPAQRPKVLNVSNSPPVIRAQSAFLAINYITMTLAVATRKGIKILRNPSEALLYWSAFFSYY